MGYWNGPSDRELRPDMVIQIINRKVNRLLQLAQLSDRSFLAVLSPPFSFNGSEMTKSMSFLDEISSIVRVESRSAGGDENNWSEETISDFGSWNDATESPIDAVAFYGSGDTLTMAVNRDASNREFRILYETGGVSLSAVNSNIPTQEFFRSALFYGVAAEAGMFIDGLDVEGENSRDRKVQFALAQEVQSIEEYKKWLLNEPGQSVQFREAFNSTRMGRGTARMNAHDQFGGYYSPY